MWRAWLLVAGGAALVAAALATSIPGAIANPVATGDVVGTACGAGGLAAIAIGGRRLLRGRRRRVQLLALPVAAAAVQWLFVPAIGAGLVTHAPRGHVAAASTLGIPGAHDVAFRTGDGVRIAAWYVPGTRPEAVILLHGSHGTRADGVDHLRLLHGAGYAVLALDSRGHGDSRGPTNALGWSAERDVAAATAYLARLGVPEQSVAALGLSMGAEVALRAAASGTSLAAVVADGAGASTRADGKLVSRGALARVADSVSWLTMRGAELVGGVGEPAPLKTVVGRIRAPVLLIASNRRDELALDRAYRDAIGGTATLWYLSDAGHTRALATHPAAYAQRVLSFLRAAFPAD